MADGRTDGRMDGVDCNIPDVFFFFFFFLNVGIIRLYYIFLIDRNNSNKKSQYTVDILSFSHVYNIILKCRGTC